MIELNKIYNMDCLDGIKDIEDNSIDLVLTDPPYLFDNSNWDVSDVNGAKSLIAHNRLYSTTGVLRDELGHFAEEEICCLFDALIPKMKKVNMFFFCSEEQVPIYGMEARKRSLHYNILVWEKPLSIINKNRFSMNTEYLVRVYDFGTGLNRLDTNDHYNKVLHDARVTDKIHPTQKPVSIFRKMIKLTTQPGDVVLDPFIGSSTTAEAAVIEKRKFIGFEKNEEYYKGANARLRKFTGPFRIYGNIGNE